jgi:hypothetical protein
VNLPTEPGLYDVEWPNACSCCEETSRKSAHVIASDIGLLVLESEYLPGWLPLTHWRFAGSVWKQIVALPPPEPPHAE